MTLVRYQENWQTAILSKNFTKFKDTSRTVSNMWLSNPIEQEVNIMFEATPSPMIAPGCPKSNHWYVFVIY